MALSELEQGRETIHELLLMNSPDCDLCLSVGSTNDDISFIPCAPFSICHVPVSLLTSYGDCAFSISAPTSCNKFSADIRNASSLEKLKSFLKHTCSRSLSQINNYYLLNHLQVFYRYIIWDIIIFHIICTAPLNGSC